jgi:hypothetical protein
MPSVMLCCRQRNAIEQAVLVEQDFITAGVALAGRRPRVEPSQFDSENRGLECIKTAISPTSI